MVESKARAKADGHRKRLEGAYVDDMQQYEIQKQVNAEAGECVKEPASVSPAVKRGFFLTIPYRILS
jgi:hypothetical protein